MTNSDQNKPKRSWLKLVGFTFVALIFSSVVLGWVFFGQYVVLFQWNDKLNKALEIAKSDSEKGRESVEQVLRDAANAHVAPDTMMGMHRSYANFLYLQDEVTRADEQIDKAIKLGEGEPPTNLGVADQLTHAWQDRATQHHFYWVTDPTKPDGAKDQEMSVKVAEAAFGPDHEQTIYKTAGLAKIYADIGRTADGDELIDRCVNAVETKDSARQCAWFVYAILAHNRAVEHKYKEALAAYFKGRGVSNDQQQSDRCWNEYIAGLRLHKDTENPLSKQTLALLSKGDFAELDRLGDKFLKEKTVYWDGYGPLETMMSSLELGPNLSDSEFNQMKLDLKTWLSKNPKSLIARSALATLHIDKAWSVHGDSGEEAGSKFVDFMNDAKNILAASPGIEDKCPAACVPMLRLTYLTQDKKELLRVNANVTKRWPDYFSIQKWTVRLLSSYLMGDEGDNVNYSTKRSDTIGGAQGDKLFARFAWFYYNNGGVERVFNAENPMDWDRIKRGFKQLFKEYPDEVEARIAFLTLALGGNHPDDARNMEW